MGLLDISYIISFLINIGLPIGLAVFVWKKFKVSWAIFFLGMALFLVSLARIPLNGYVTSLIRQNFNSYIIYNALFASFTAALFEEGVRVLGLGLIVRQKNYFKGLMYGIGHGGGGEAMVFIGFTGIANYVIYKLFPGIIPGSEALGNIQWYLPLVGSLERIFAIAIQIFLSVLVMHAFMSKKYYFIAIAFFFHLLVDFVAIYVNNEFGIAAAEITVFCFAVIAVVLTVLLRPKNFNSFKL
ncbi:MAG: YhfC family glutamic-type intramembrane protease [Actinomycetota bacterium]